MNARMALSLVFATFTAFSFSPAATAQSHRPLPYPRSTVIDRLVWESGPSKYPG